MLSMNNSSTSAIQQLKLEATLGQRPRSVMLPAVCVQTSWPDLSASDWARCHTAAFQHACSQSIQAEQPSETVCSQQQPRQALSSSCHAEQHDVLEEADMRTALV